MYPKKKNLAAFVYFIDICDFWISIRTIYEEKCIKFLSPTYNNVTFYKYSTIN